MHVTKIAKIYFMNVWAIIENYQAYETLKNMSLKCYYTFSHFFWKVCFQFLLFIFCLVREIKLKVQNELPIEYQGYIFKVGPESYNNQIKLKHDIAKKIRIVHENHNTIYSILRVLKFILQLFLQCMFSVVPFLYAIHFFKILAFQS